MACRDCSVSRRGRSQGWVVVSMGQGSLLEDGFRVVCFHLDLEYCTGQLGPLVPQSISIHV